MITFFSTEHYRNLMAAASSLTERAQAELLAAFAYHPTLSLQCSIGRLCMRLPLDPTRPDTYV